jgi:hypothetical protein
MTDNTYIKHFKLLVWKEDVCWIAEPQEIIARVVVFKLGKLEEKFDEYMRDLIEACDCPDEELTVAMVKNKNFFKMKGWIK